jgi:hypothetical protein
VGKSFFVRMVIDNSGVSGRRCAYEFGQQVPMRAIKQQRPTTPKASACWNKQLGSGLRLPMVLKSTVLIAK